MGYHNILITRRETSNGATVALLASYKKRIDENQNLTDAEKLPVSQLPVPPLSDAAIATPLAPAVGRVGMIIEKKITAPIDGYYHRRQILTVIARARALVLARQHVGV